MCLCHALHGTELDPTVPSLTVTIILRVELNEQRLQNDDIDLDFQLSSGLTAFSGFTRVWDCTNSSALLTLSWAFQNSKIVLHAEWSPRTNARHSKGG